MKKIPLIFALTVGLLTSASTAMAQTVNMSSYITLTVAKDSAIRLDFKAASAGTPVRIVSGTNTQDITVGTDWYDGNAPSTFTVTAAASTMTIYGDIIDFDCQSNGANLTALDPSHNTQLTKLSCNNSSLNSLDVSGCTQLKELRCYSNLLTSLDVSQNTQLTELDCFRNDISSLDVSQNTQLMELSCGSNKLTSLDVSKNTKLTKLYCQSNKLTTLDVSKNTKLERLGCSNNRLSTLDISKNTQLMYLYCMGNSFSTQTLDDIYCALPARLPSDNAQIFPLNVESPISEQNMVTATNAANASAKNWRVLTARGFAPPTKIATTGTYMCQVNTSHYITLTVTNGAAIKLDFAAAAAATPVRIVSGSNTQDITVGTDWYDGNVPSTYTVTARASTMTVYGDLTGFSCRSNGENLTDIDVSNNTQLKNLYCSSNLLTTLDVSRCTQLDDLDCSNNNLTTLDVSGCTQLTMLHCSENRLSSLDVSKNTQLMRLDCFNNRLSNLDISHNTQLRWLYCHGNNFSTAALDDIFCAIPDRTGTYNGLIEPVYSDTSSNHAIVLATNVQNAIAKNWKVQYENYKNIYATTGTYVCGTPHTDIAEASAEQALTLYPNPVADVLYLSATARTIRIYNIYGIEVAHAYDTDRIDVAHLPEGVYTVRADGTVAKMVKR